MAFLGEIEPLLLFKGFHVKATEVVLPADFQEKAKELYTGRKKIQMFGESYTRGVYIMLDKPGLS